MAKPFLSNSQRARFCKGKQKEYLELAIDKINQSNDEVARAINVHPRSLRDWRREKYLISLPALTDISKLAGIPMPDNIEVVKPFWYTTIGANAGWLAVIKKYGFIPKNEKLRKKKWKEWWEKKGQYNPNQYFVQRDIYLPSHKSPLLAEFMGILLGDGGITSRQVSITLHKEDDKEYIRHVAKICEDLFKTSPSLIYHKGEMVCDIIISRTKLVSYLLSLGLLVGNKVKQQVNVPTWVSNSRSYAKNCLRGLFDTDGCFYLDKHRYKDKIYYNCGMNFTNRSLPLLNFFKDKLEQYHFNPTQSTKYSVFLRKEKEIIRYFQEIGSSNPKHFNKFRNYLVNKFGEVPKWS